MSSLNSRTLDIFRHIVDTFFETGEPIGSKTLSTKLSSKLSPATIRNIMAQLEDLGYLYSPHTSAGRLPTEHGLRFFVNGLLETGNLPLEEQEAIERSCSKKNVDVSHIMKEASAVLSGLSSCASIVLAPKNDQRIKHIEFVQINVTQALAILVKSDSQVENRLIDIPAGMPPSVLTQASNYLNHKLSNLTLQEAVTEIETDLRTHQSELDGLALEVINKGLASWSKSGEEESLIVHGQSHLLDNVENVEDLERIRHIFSILETKKNLKNLLEASSEGDGVQIFIGSDNKLFKMAGCSLVLSPFENSQGNVIGAVGVIGPSRINYGRIIPMVDYTAKVVGRLLD